MRKKGLTPYAINAYHHLMKLSDWMKTNDVNDTILAKRMGHKRPDKVRRWRLELCKPQTDEEMQLLHKVTDKQVSANDFFGITASQTIQ